MLGPIQLEFGYIFGQGNELTLGSTVPAPGDPPKFRQGAVAGMGLAAWSGNRLVPDSSQPSGFRQNETVLMQFKDLNEHDPAHPIGEFTVHMLDGTGVDDISMKEALRITMAGPQKGVYVFGHKVT